MAKNICSCPDPPGGRAVCEAHQAAYCRVHNGVVEYGCEDPPDVSALARVVGQQVLDNWALKSITRSPRRPTAPITIGERNILASGRYKNPKSGEEVRFKLPWLASTAGHGGEGGGSRNDGSFEPSRERGREGDLEASRLTPQDNAEDQTLEDTGAVQSAD